MLYQIKNYFIFILRSTNQHGIHSPFVYNLVTKCFYLKNKKIHSELNDFNSYRKNLLSNNQTIEVNDFGAGSKVFKSNRRKVKDIAKTAGISIKEAKLLIKIVNYFKPKTILELGTSLGLGSYCLHLGYPEAKITTLEGCPETSRIARELLNKHTEDQIQVVTGNFKETLPKVLKQNKFDMIYFDGNHQKNATLDYFYQALKTIHNESFFIFDDIHWSKGMEAAWNIIKDHPKVSVSIDLFFWGIVFFRKEQPKQHFNIRV